MTFEILSFEGNFVPITSYIAQHGLDYQLSDIDDPNTGRTMAGTMQRGKIADKDKWKIKCRPLTTAEMSIVLQLISHEYVTARYLSPRYNSIVEKVMYVGDRTASHYVHKDNKIFWDALSFSLIER